MGHRARQWILLVMFCACPAFSLGCGSDTQPPEDALSEGLGRDAGADTGDRTEDDNDASRLLVTADWLNRSLTLFEVQRLVDGASTATEASIGTIPLNVAGPGPLQIEITPDRRKAVVTSGPGFFAGVAGLLLGGPEIPEGGGVLIVNLESGDVEAELSPAHLPMGIAISPDGRRAYTANYGTESAAGRTMTVIDLERNMILSDITVGPRPEQVALSHDGRLGLINLAGRGGVKLFETNDPELTLSARVDTGDDPSDVVFLEGDSRALVTNSQAVTYSVLTLSGGASDDVAVESFPLGAGDKFPYAATLVPGTSTVLMTLSSVATELVAVDLSAQPPSAATPIALPGGPFLMGVAVDPEGRFAFVPHPEDRSLSVVTLATGEVRRLDGWLTEVGPTYAAIQP